MRREEIVWQYFPVRESQQLQLVSREEAQLRAQAFELSCTLDYDDIEAIVPAHRLGERQRRRRFRRAGASAACAARVWE